MEPVCSPLQTRHVVLCSKDEVKLTCFCFLATPHGPINQRTFLTSLGLAPRLDKLLQSAKTKERKLDIANAARRLVDENGMGGEYQFLGITPRAVPKDESKPPAPVYPFDMGNP